MPKRRKITFDNRSTVAAYNDLQVPAIFLPWASRLAEGHDDWRGRTVLDLATGTGIVAQVLAPRVGPDGVIICVDISPEMLDLARRRCAGLEPEIGFILSAAHPLEVPDASVDMVVCQQGFQFFPDPSAAAREIYRVLRPGGAVMAMVWTSLAECDFFCQVRNALAIIGEPDLADRMRLPFDFMPAPELSRYFSGADFEDIHVDRHELEFEFEGGMAQAIQTAWSTVVGPDLAAMPEEKQAGFRTTLEGLLMELSGGGRTVGRTVSNLLTAEKPRLPG